MRRTWNFVLWNPCSAAPHLLPPTTFYHPRCQHQTMDQQAQTCTNWPHGSLSHVQPAVIVPRMLMSRRARRHAVNMVQRRTKKGARFPLVLCISGSGYSLCAALRRSLALSTKSITLTTTTDNLPNALNILGRQAVDLYHRQFSTRPRNPRGISPTVLYNINLDVDISASRR